MHCVIAKCIVCNASCYEIYTWHGQFALIMAKKMNSVIKALSCNMIIYALKH